MKRGLEQPAEIDEGRDNKFRHRANNLLLVFLKEFNNMQALPKHHCKPRSGSVVMGRKMP